MAGSSDAATSQGSAASRQRPLIFAGSHAQADFYARQMGLTPSEWTYLLPHVARGRMNPTVYVVGTYYERPDFQEVMSALIPAQPTFLNEQGEEVVP